MTRRTVPHFHLYGEAESFADPGFVHMETIESRSLSNNWEIRPHQHEQLDQMLVLRTGSVTARIEGQTFTVPGPLVIHVPANTIHGFVFAKAVEGDVLTFAAQLGHSVLPAHSPSGLLPEGAALLPLTGAQMQQAVHLLDALRTETSGHAPGRIAAASWTVALLLLHIRRWQSDEPSSILSDRIDDRGRDAMRARSFRALVDAHFAQQRTVSFYADRMGITEKTLARMCLARFDCAPKQYLHRRVLLEAQRMLTYSGATITEIAYDLGFTDPSYFTRFYRRMTGTLPSVHRT